MGEAEETEGKKSVQDKLSVRDLVTFILQSGDLDNRSSGFDPDAMQEGARLHRKLQKAKGAEYRAEVPLSLTEVVERNGVLYEICVEGRADGIIRTGAGGWDAAEVTPVQATITDDQKAQETAVTDGQKAQGKTDSPCEAAGMQSAETVVGSQETTASDCQETAPTDNQETAAAGGQGALAATASAVAAQLCFFADGSICEEQPEAGLPEVLIDEIKVVTCELQRLTAPASVHLAQAKCYAYIYAKQRGLSEIGVQLTYCHAKTERTKLFYETFSFDALRDWYLALLLEYAKWVEWRMNWKITRDESLKQQQFPFAYRTGQRELAAGCYRTIQRGKRLFIEAPTGVGKTISTVFPAVKAIGEGLCEKLFYMTAKTITRTVAQEAFRLLEERGAQLSYVTLTAKEKICVLEKPDCNPAGCARAEGHYDRVNDAVYDLLTNERQFTREQILRYAEKHRVCPFEMSLDVALFADCVICDYNYVFDPTAYLRRFFAEERKKNYVFLIDEAHNLVERARSMYSAELYKQAFLDMKKRLPPYEKQLIKQLDACNSALLSIKRVCEDCEVLEEIDGLALLLMRLLTELEHFMEENPSLPEKEETLRFYLELRFFCSIYEQLDEAYLICADYNEAREFRLRLLCMDPSKRLRERLDKGIGAVFFSATLLPIRYYMEQLGGTEEDYAVYAPSPFLPENRLLMLARDVSTKYTRRSEAEYRRILTYIRDFTDARVGNYMVFFPSYQMLQEIAQLAEGVLPGLVLQESGMREEEREAFLSAFAADATETKVGFCVMGGIFSEGIDLRADRLIGAVIVGTGLPMVCNERELYRGYYDNRNGCGFEYAYLYPGMNKVLQSAGRVIRTISDRGAILLLDERFLQRQYQALFPREWFPYEVVDCAGMRKKLDEFWAKECVE